MGITKRFKMKTYEIVVREVLSRVVEIEADSSEEAIEKVTMMYKNEDLVLDAEDYSNTDIICLNNIE